MLSIKAFLRVFYAFGFIRSKEMVASNLKLKPLFFYVSIDRYFNVGCGMNNVNLQVVNIESKN